MKADARSALEFISTNRQFTIPIYQRTYSWTQTQCEQLWEDILRVGGSDQPLEHFIGSVVYILDGHDHEAGCLVIDGQQRLTTLTLLLIALSNALGEDGTVNDMSAEELREDYLINRHKKGDLKYKLLLTQTDRNTLCALVDGIDPEGEISLRVEENHSYFAKKIAALSAAERETLLRGLTSLRLVYVALDREHDNAQMIFESMNSTGLALSHADLIRNFILMGLPAEEQTRLYEHYWRPMERDFGQQAYAAEFDNFVRAWLTWKNGGNVPSKPKVYEEFKHFVLNKKAFADTEALVSSLRTSASHYARIALGKKSDAKLERAFADLNELKVEVSYPFLLEVYQDFDDGHLDLESFIQIIRLVESYAFRRSMVHLPSNSMQKTFAAFTRSPQSLDKENYLESVSAKFLALLGRQRMPNDEDFTGWLVENDLYNTPRRTYWLRKIENYGRKERVEVESCTIEHIMPQTLTEEWKSALGDDYEQTHEWCHTLGNLTLTANNAALSNLPFEKKRDMENGLGDSPLRLNAGMAKIKKWDMDAIEQRAARLADRAVEVWPMAEASQDVVAANRKLQKGKGEAWMPIALEDHKHLEVGSDARALFDKLHKGLVALDATVYMEPFKSYVAFKLESNFVDVSARSGWLKLYFQISPNELVDERGLVNEVQNVGRNSTGQVSMDLRSFDDVAYAVGIARQSLELQLG